MLYWCTYSNVALYIFCLVFKYLCLKTFSACSFTYKILLETMKKLMSSVIDGIQIPATLYNMIPFL